MPSGSELSDTAIFGRSSSHFTRVTRIFAAELHIEHSFALVPDLMSRNPDDYGGNPSLKLPTLRTPRGVWFGALGICRELARMSKRGKRIEWPEDLDDPLPANAQELVAQAMATEVSLIMAKVSGNEDGGEHLGKMMLSLSNAMSWLEKNADRILASLPADRDLSYLEVTLFCLVTHLEFRKVLPTKPYLELNRFCQQFALRNSARETNYRFDN